MKSTISFENDLFRLVLSENGKVRSLKLKASDEELAYEDDSVSFFSVTQNRPFNNEVKLSQLNKRTTWQANHVSLDGDLLRVEFEIVPVKANIRVRIAPKYMLFTLESFTVLPEDYDTLKMDKPPVTEFSLCQLSLRPRKNFGEWLNVLWDDTACINVLAASVNERIYSEQRKDNLILKADAVRGIKMEGSCAGLIACRPDEFLDVMDIYEKELGLPEGAKARKAPYINRSVYWTSDLCPANVDEHIAWAKKGGFSMMLLYYTCFCIEEGGYNYTGNYDYNDRYPRGMEDLQFVLQKIHDAGITPGFHFLQTHIGMKSRYVTPVADQRLGKKEAYTLSKTYEDGDDKLMVDEDPSWAPEHPDCRVLHFGGELFTYEGVTTERPYAFTGVKRGAFGTLPETHVKSQVGYVLDISEYGTTSCYIDQKTDLQDEIADKLASFYNAGFEFCYMDGSEGAMVPFDHHVPSAQMRVFEKFKKKPLFTEGAAKAHFSWHFQAGANAFDIFPPSKFKDAIVKYPAAEAPLMRKNFTRLDFGWWGFWAPNEKDYGIQADMYEFGTSVAAAWDCPAAVMGDLDRFSQHPRINDIMEVMNRWEEVRKQGWLTDDMQDQLKDTSKEHTLYVNEQGAFELLEIHPVDAHEPLTVYLAPYHGKTMIVLWHRTGEGWLQIDLGGEQGEKRVHVSDRQWIMSDLTEDQVRKAFTEAKIS